MPLLNKLFGKKEIKKEETKKEIKKELIKKEKVEAPKKRVILDSKILGSPHTAEKAIAGQKLNQYVFKVAPSANKIEIAKAIGKNYNVKVVGVNIINVPKKSRRVGKNLGFKSGYKKAIIALAKGQTIEIK